MEAHNIILTESQVAEIQRRLKTDAAVDNHLDEAMNEEVSTEDINMKPFEPKNALNPKLWYNNKLNSKVRLRLLDIADEFVDDLNIKWVKPEDIVITGSMANYNWNKYSDIDLHIIMDYSKIFRRTDFVEDYFKTKKNAWSTDHENLKIYGFPVEIFVEDSNAPAEASGVYSLEKNEWVKEPKDLSDATLNKDYVKKYCADTINSIDDIIESLDGEEDNKRAETKYKKLSRIFERLKELRKSGLATKAKEMSSGNIIWKVLRAMGYIDKLSDAKHRAYDREMSITESSNNGENVGYHAGDLGKAEHFGRMFYGGRDTGHFGTGTYFTSTKDKLKTGGYKDRPIHKVPFDNYKLVKINDGELAMKFHDALKYINNTAFWNMIVKGSVDREALKKVCWVIAAVLFGNEIQSFNDMPKYRNKVYERVMGLLKQYKENYNPDYFSNFDSKENSISTELIKSFGFEGVDVRGCETMDNTMYGSVIYDLKS